MLVSAIAFTLVVLSGGGGSYLYIVAVYDASHMSCATVTIFQVISVE